ncbi:MAG: PAS domain S-box protein [Calditrichae bacterium]|nr:PAS domain S-box protein [Calditrichia bacterium]
MKSKILLLRDQFTKDIGPDFFSQWDYIDLLNYDTIGELPLNYTDEIYQSILFLPNKVNADIIDYLNKLRLYNNKQIIFVLGNVSKEDLYRKLQNIENCYFYEKSIYVKEQIHHLLHQLEITTNRNTVFKQALENARQTILNAPENIVQIDSEGIIVSANHAFLKNFKFSEKQILRIHISRYVPNFSTKNLHTLNEFEKNHGIPTTFLDINDKIIPVLIRPVNAVQPKGHSYLFVYDRSELLNYKRQSEHQQRIFNDIQEFFHDFILSSQTPEIKQKNGPFKLFNSDTILICNFNRSTFQKPEIDFTPFNDNEKDIVKALEGIIYTLQRKNDIAVLDFSHENPAHSNIINFAQTVIFIPVTTPTNNSIILLLYVNHFEPDPLLNNALQLFKELFALGLDATTLVLNKSFKDQNFKEIVENAVDGIYRSTTDGKIIYANHAFIKMLGYNSLEEISDIHIAADLYEKKEDREEFVKELKNHSGVKNYITSLRRKDGKVVSIVEHAHLVKQNDGMEYIEGVLRDISENMQLEENLKKSRLFSNNLIENASLIISVKNDDNIYLIWNKMAEKVTGYSKKEIIGNVDAFKMLFPEKSYRDHIKEDFDDYLNQKHVKPIETELTAANGSKKTISWTVIRLKTDDGLYVNVHFGTDLTEIRLLEQRLHDNRQMEMFNSLTDKIAKKYKEVFSSVLSTLDNARKKTLNTELVLKQTEQKIREAHQFSDLILSLSGTDTHSVKYRTDADEVIENSIYVLNKTIPPGIKIDAELNTHGRVSISEAQLNQIILNLALNSVDAIGEKGNIFISTYITRPVDNPFLKISNAYDSDYLQLSFNDNGKGMDSITRKRMFEPFFTTSGDQNRKGLGATLIFNIVKSVNGFVSVESKENNGTNITIYLPIDKSKAEDKKDNQESRNDLKILVVDDQSVIRELLTDIAGTDGYNTLLAKDGLEGLDMFKKHNTEIGLAILDIKMPNLNGNELYYKLKEINPELKVIITYGHHDPKIQQQLKKDGANGFLPKPFDIHTARDQIRTLLR